jgi:16S rRNA (guanine966-N2)-methyltransferase
MLKGRRMVAPAGTTTRPTIDRIRESIFNILAGSIQDKRVLDLFAGSGALGIEALSRGAVSAVFVDQAKAALLCIRRNLQNLGLEDRARVILWDIRKDLKCLISHKHSFDLVFMDPPYETGAVAPALHNLVASGTLAPRARLVIEHSIREQITIPIDTLSLVDQRRFGKTLVSFLDSVL